MTSKKLEELYSKFKKLSEENQYFIIGYSEGLRQVQNESKKKLPDIKPAVMNEKQAPGGYSQFPQDSAARTPYAP
jgi:hypothetical protein